MIPSSLATLEMFSILFGSLGWVANISVHELPFNGFTIHSKEVDGAFYCFDCNLSTRFNYEIGRFRIA